MKYFAKIKYLGTDFHGFQVQPGKRTVQSELNRALAETFGHSCRITGCSRTDSGVHANEFCITVEPDAGYIPPEKLSLAAARFLPQDISLFYAKECDQDFHPRYDVIGKEYVYKIYNDRVADPFWHRRSWFLPRIITDEGMKKMRQAAEYILGEHDFTSFMAADSDTQDTVRRVDYIKIDRVGPMVELRIFANGFLYNMVRIIVGTLCEVAFGRFEPSDIADIIAARNRLFAGMTAPPDGLYLNRVDYEKI
ncbi:MAG: tRNA pseudouridine(38-40) synthase TruA [Ruminococcaceae bacterium]|nr:tRNA pseudouridine(38-40) synthase TruA [Oscillospiraceae bacterium]